MTTTMTRGTGTAADRFVTLAARIGLVAVTVTVLYFSLRPAMTIIETSDKVLHALAYCAWSLTALLSLRNQLAQVVVALLIVLAGGLIELVQPMVGRVADWLDFAANTSGVVLGSLLTVLVRAVLGRLSRMPA